MTTAGVGSSDRILALPGPEPTLAALVRLAKAKGWDVTLLARLPEEQQKYVGQFDIADDKVLLANVKARKCGGSFPHTGSLNETSLESALDPLPFTRGASFIPTSINALCTTAATEVLRQTLHLVQEYPELADNVGFVFDISDLAQSTERLRESSTTKIGVVSYPYSETPMKIIPQLPSVTFSPNASYLLIGCLGGLGRSLTRFMMERSAKHFAFVSRSGVPCRPASESDVVRIVQEVNAKRPIREVVHAAMLLKDGLFEQMDPPIFQAAVDPNVIGAVSLSKALQDIDLDFFVMTSSISATLGNPGQNNYSAANSFLDTLTWQHRLCSRAGVSLVFSMVLDVAVVAENASIEPPSSEREMLRGFEVTMSRPTTQTTSLQQIGNSQTILGLAPSELAKGVLSDPTVDAYWYQDARFVHLCSEVERIGKSASSSPSRSGGLQNLLANISSTSPEEIITAIAQFIAQRVASILLLSADDFNLDGLSIVSYGLDSMIGAEMRN
ncbi:beta-ketoacyl reductase [Aspergillus tanneri]|uniref:Ketoreductase domain-containing protein n=1 Tax=Aspergillus tanneri TaxID=1220188 RepID=A0A5M9MNT2_9EURO|nr:uncharacterized protein ATNIH1004_004523 [Aspergillus tanneri]KAA8648638.1 hypothetical protein ATNIH1004_004523 [Aspergillus tanneri]